MPQPDADRAGPPPSRGRRLLRVALVLLGVTWGVVVPVLGVQALLQTMTFLGEQPTAADRADQHHGITVALGVSVVIVVVGLGLSVLARSNAGGWVFAALLVPTLVLALLWLATVQAPGQDAPAVPDAPGGACQEHSGGGTRRPGG